MQDSVDRQVGTTSASKGKQKANSSVVSPMLDRSTLDDEDSDREAADMQEAIQASLHSSNVRQGESSSNRTFQDVVMADGTGTSSSEKKDSSSSTARPTSDDLELRGRKRPREDSSLEGGSVQRSLLERLTSSSPQRDDSTRSKEPASGPTLLARLSHGTHNDGPPSLLSRLNVVPSTSLMDRMSEQVVVASAEKKATSSTQNTTSAPELTTAYGPDSPLHGVATFAAAVLRPSNKPLSIPPVSPITTGHIHLLSRSKLRVAIWRDACMLPWSDVVGFMLSKGIPFAWSYPNSRLPQPIPTLPESWTGYVQEPSHVVRWWEARANIWDAYLATVHDLLAQPNARMFLHMGGLAWRLAVQFGSPSLLEDAARGPSRLVTDYGVGEATTDPVPGHVDSGSKADFDRLFGTKSGRSLWPRQKDFLDSRAWNGEWSWSNEVWFSTRLTALSSAKRDDNLTPNQWSRELRDSLRPAERRAPNGPGSEVHAEGKINADPDIAALGILDLEALQSSWDISVSTSSAETGGAL
ncbi:hypothetical protein FA95DRAFT_1613292 [Auriscalpium vulgare]|uniref:Uncharacterized protein n=1 Tax=Auriscalpium vulgare TaxID=40419 RepID=A0ACB8R368_9AGAM|nr:hypothetical protein FA95DRAFT_1613292 [Auriscalpium vulgare]